MRYHRFILIKHTIDLNKSMLYNKNFIDVKEIHIHLFAFDEARSVSEQEIHNQMGQS